MKRRLLPLLLLLGACSVDPTTGYLFGIGDPVRGAALSAPVRLGNTAHLAGDPVAAARGVILLEFIDDSFRTDPLYMHDVSPANQQIIRRGRDEMRAAVGIAPNAPAGPLMAQLRDFANALEAGSLARAEAALSGPMFPLGAEATLQRLRTLPRLPRVSEAAGAAANEINRLDSRRSTIGG
ncbi:hypothetical protein DFH01_16415 [Falsiroseomonas bella]|uniref:Uncharacterized protein n=1 Tax=Falsiroseomonas bella TaxID=2184016 RepID=A0A317FC66_9PROT|nr:hypothetical protein [Falsiroseomonas bella]PWS36714.1 hypothetical protein DFH01_16415 [Falsiroseomonas bella]